MQFKAQSNPSTLLTLAKDPAHPRFQLFLDFLAVPVVLLAQTIAGTQLKNFSDNYLCLFYVLKLIVDGGFYMYADTECKQYGRQLFALRMSYDILTFICGYLLMKYDNLHEICYIVFCTIIFIELSASTITTFLIADQEEERVEIEHALPQGDTEALATGDLSPGSEAHLIFKDKSPSKSSMISGSTMAGSVNSFVSGKTAF